MNQNMGLAICVIINLFSIAILIYSLTQPVATVANELYFFHTKMCGDSDGKTCEDILPLFRTIFTALYALTITLIILLVLCIVNKMLKLTKVCDILGLLVLGVAVAIFTLLLVINNRYNITFEIGGQMYLDIKLTSSILVLITCALLTIKQLWFNKLLHAILMAPIRMVSRK
jgi:hypothetical protein